MNANSLWLNLGSGSFYTEEWCNVDLYAEDADVKASAFDLPFPDSHFTRGYLGHILEHIVYDKIPELWQEVNRVCAVGSKIIVVGPCMDKAIATHQPEWLLEDIRPGIPSAWGVQQGSPTVDVFAPGVQHEWTATTELTLQAMRTGLDSVEEIDIQLTLYPATPNRVTDRWQCACKGVTR